MKRYLCAYATLADTLIGEEPSHDWRMEAEPHGFYASVERAKEECLRETIEIFTNNRVSAHFLGSVFDPARCVWVNSKADDEGHIVHYKLMYGEMQIAHLTCRELAAYGD